MTGAKLKIGNTAKLFSLLADKIYTDKIRAVIREVSCNAKDIHDQVGQTRPFYVSLPSRLDPTFSVRDFGTGLSNELMETLYTTFFESTKTSTAQIGGKGLGSKSPFAYADMFTVTSYQAGVRSVYAAFRNADGEPELSPPEITPTDEPNGLEVKVPVKLGDLTEFAQKAQEVLRWFLEGSFQLFGGKIKQVKRLIEGDGYITIPHGEYYNIILMGPVAYRVEWHQLGLVLPTTIVPVFNVNDFEPHDSREQLVYDATTLAALKQKHADITAALCEDALARAETMTPIERIELVDDLREGGLSKLFDDYHKWSGHRTKDEAAAKTGAPRKWGSILKYEHERIRIECKALIYDRAGRRSRGSMWLNSKPAQFDRLVIERPSQLRGKFVHYDLADDVKTPRIYDRLEANTTGSDRVTVLFGDVPDFITTIPLSSMEPPPKQPRVKSAVRVWTRLERSCWVQETGHWTTGIYVPFVLNDEEPGYSKYLQLPMMQGVKVLGLTKTARARLKGNFVRIDDHVRAQAKLLMQDPDILRAFSADNILAELANVPVMRLISYRAAIGDESLFPEAVKAVRGLQDDVQLVDVHSLHKLAGMGIVTLPKARDFHKAKSAVTRVSKRNPSLELLLQVWDRTVSLNLSSNDQFERIAR